MTPLHPKLREALLNHRKHSQLTNSQLDEYEELLAREFYKKAYPTHFVVNSSILHVLETEKALEKTKEQLTKITKKKYRNKGTAISDIENSIGANEYQKFKDDIQASVEPQQIAPTTIIKDYQDEHMPAYKKVYEKWVRRQKRAVQRNEFELNPMKMDLSKIVIGLFVAILVGIVYYPSKIPTVPIPPPDKVVPDSANTKEKQLLDTVATSINEGDLDKMKEILKKKDLSIVTSFTKHY